MLEKPSDIEALVKADPVSDVDRRRLKVLQPKKRSECINKPRPCTWVSCKWNTYISVNPDGSIEHPDCDVTEMTVSNCALDYIGKEPRLEDVAKAFGISVQRIQKIESRAVEVLKFRIRESSVDFAESKESNLAGAQLFAFGD